MLKSEIRPGTEYAFREKRTPGSPLQRIRAIEHIQKTTAKPLGGNKFNLVTDTLKKGDYIIYVEGTADSIKHIAGRGYDFTVE